MKRPLVSFVTMAYNREGFIAETLESVLRQTEPFTEVIVVDDGSTDDTSEVVKPFVDRGVIYKRIQHGGAAKARNVGVSLAIGDYICTAGSDDVLFPDTLGSYLASYRDFPDCELYYGDLIATDAALNPRFRVEYPDWSGCEDRLLTALSLTNQLGDTCCLAKRSWVLDNGLYDETYLRCQDWDFWSRALPGKKVRHIGRSIGYWRWHDRNISAGSQPKDQKYDSMIRDRLLSSKEGRDHLLALDWWGALARNSGRSVFIWGAGDYGIAVYHLLESCKVEVAGWIDSNAEKQGRSLLGLEIEGPSFLTNASERGLPLVVVASVFEHEISLELEKLGMEESVDFLLVRGVRYNCGFLKGVVA